LRVGLTTRLHQEGQDQQRLAYASKRAATRSWSSTLCYSSAPPLSSFFRATASSSTRLFASTATTAESKDSSSSLAFSSSPDMPPHVAPLVGIDWLQDVVVDVLNDLYDPKQVARGNVLAKLESISTSTSKKKKKSKKSKSPASTDDTVAIDNANAEMENDTAPPPPPKELSQEEKDVIVQAAMEAAPSSFSRADAMVAPATKPEFGDYQVNAAMGLARSLQLNPRDCAAQILQRLQPRIDAYMQRAEIAGPGFINVKFRHDYLQTAARNMAADARNRLAIAPVRHGQKIVVDFSSPNIAKEMHVGHLRSTIVGDCICNLLEFLGHDVVRLNHVGDWGTQFGMLLEHLRDEYPQALNVETAQNVELGDLVLLYKAAKKRFDDEEDFKRRARESVVKLQAGNAEEVAAWEALCAASRMEYEKIYNLLNIKGLKERGESFYNPYLNEVVEYLQDKGMAVESDGALVVFLDGYTNRDGSPLPMIVRKSDGGFNYATTDLAAIRHRTSLSKETDGSGGGGEEADRVLYVTDAGQAQHFEMVFEAAKRAGLCRDGASLEHVPFGLVQGDDGKKFATRSGDTVKLKDLLNEAIRIAGADIRSRNKDKADKAFEARVDRVARIVGIGAVKYADLSMNRESNYRFSYERMLSLNGNTAPYMLYAYARICGIIRKASGQESDADVEWPAAAQEIILSHETEEDLVRTLVKLQDLLLEVERDLYPNRICDFLFETSQKFNQFYENCSVNAAETPELKASRLSLCMATAGTIRLLLGILGIEVVEKL
jgi:arginyl-tRNA synthetase